MAEKIFDGGQIKRLGLIGAVPHFYTAVNLQYKNNTSAKLNDEVADIYEKATGEVVSRNWACGHCAFELFRKAGVLYYNSLKKQEENARKAEVNGSGRSKGEGQGKGGEKGKGKGRESKGKGAVKA